LDKDTSGLLVVAKDDWVHAKLAEQFSKHTAEREYNAICWGRFEKNEGTIETYITRSKKDRKKFTVSEAEGKQAITMYKVIEEFEFTTLIMLNLKTGRTHQIRVHLTSIGKPIFGDATYGGRQIRSGSELLQIKQRVHDLLEIMPRQALHAKTLGFIHPKTKEKMSFDSKLPEDFQQLISILRNQSSDK